MDRFDQSKAREILKDLNHPMTAREKAEIAYKLFKAVEDHYAGQIYALEARVKVLEQDVILAELLKIRNLSDRILKEVEPRESPDVD